MNQKKVITIFILEVQEPCKHSYFYFLILSHFYKVLIRACGKNLSHFKKVLITPCGKNLSHFYKVLITASGKKALTL